MCHVALVEIERGERQELAEFLTPLCKVFGSEAGIKAADLGIQILGGYGYLDEYGMHHIWRDARICAIYEGANGIHTRGLVTRGLRMGKAADQFEDVILELAGGDARVDASLSNWRDRRAKLERMPDPTPEAHAFYKLTSGLYLRAVWARIAAVADRHRDSQRLVRLAESVLNGEVTE